MKLSDLTTALEKSKGKKLALDVRVPSWLEKKTKTALTGTVKAEYAGRAKFSTNGERGVKVPVSIKGKRYEVRLQDLSL